MTNFSTGKNVRISSLTPDTMVKLRVGKSAVKSADDVTVEAKLIRKYEEGEKSLVEFQETGADGSVSELVISRFPHAPWRTGNQFVSLLALDESTFTIQQGASPIQTDVIGDAIALIQREAEDMFAPQQLIALLAQIKDGKRVNVSVKELAIALATKLVEELSILPDEPSAA